MSAKIQPWEASGGSTKNRTRGSFDNGGDQQSATKSPRSVGKLSRQNSLQGTSGKHRRNLSIALDDGDDGLTDHSGASTRGPNSARSSKGRSRKSLGSKAGKKRVSFSTPLVDPRPEKIFDNSNTFGADYSLNEDEFTSFNDADTSDSIIPKRMRKRRRGAGGRWRRFLPFGQYIPTLPSFSFSLFGSRQKDHD